MVKSAKLWNFLLTEITSPDPTLQVPLGPAAQFTHVLPVSNPGQEHHLQSLGTCCWSGEGGQWASFGAK